jgi:GNAT superfamily N-acetyltransferase
MTDDGRTGAPLDVGPLQRSELEDALGLSTAAGWNQVRQDWERVCALPGSAFGGRSDGTVVATATTVQLGGVVWIGMVLVHPEYRGNGFGSAIVDRALEAARDEGEEVGLDATDAGRPIYADRGFEPTDPVTRWTGTSPTGEHSTTQGSRADAVERVRPLTDAERVAAFDRERCGVDRTVLLERLLNEPGTAGFVLHSEDAVDGYAIVRPGRLHAQVGPLVVDDLDAVRPLIESARAAVEKECLLVDTIGGTDGPVGERLHELGFDPDRSLTRMSRSGNSLLTGPGVVGLAGLELG